MSNDEAALYSKDYCRNLESDWYSAQFPGSPSSRDPRTHDRTEESATINYAELRDDVIAQTGKMAPTRGGTTSSRPRAMRPVV